jgi:hypothetical protein
MPAYFTGKNLFGVTRQGALSYTKTTTAFSKEPTDVAYNLNNGHLFVSDDDKKRIFEVNPGTDGVLHTSDDLITSFSTSAFNSNDPEGLDYDPGSGHLFIADGVNNEVYRVNPGANRIFDGVPASGGDDSVTHFDTAVNGIQDPEGVDFNPATGNLILVTNNNRTRMFEVTPAGALVQTFDISAANGLKLAGVQMAPGSKNSSVMNYYIVDRRVDNNADPNENDGKIYEFSSAANPPTATPTPTNPPGPTPTPTPTQGSGDLIFADGFEAGNLSAWSASATGGGDLSVSPAAALVGGFGLQAVINDNTALYLTDDSPAAEARYRARFYFDPNSIGMVSGDNHYLFYGYAGTSTAVVRVQFRFSNGSYQLRVALRDDASTWTTSTWFPISDAVHFIEVDWRAATAAGANNGALTLWIDGVQKASFTAADNDTRRIDRVRLGAVAGIDAGTRGTYDVDAFESRRQSYIGPAAGALVAAVAPSALDPVGLTAWTEEEDVPEEVAEEVQAQQLFLPLVHR